ncbi:Hypothetical protein, putative [Bodo saltans]|uniref:Uncharacterized protein n=1 Tax=Bodo saltans TaxID=75058 RepID=A0A0S4KMM8_BODSA|nr:Hypothetical protein, putative [Bodo saltans]|eukprot:CUI14763.1 Hypothetical protein, putative [Bodo saltans]
MLLDAWELWSAVKRRFADWQTRGIVVDSKSSDSTPMKLSLMTSNFLNDEGGSNDDVVATAEKLLADDFIVVAPMAIERCISPMVFGEGNYAHDFDLVFWDDGGLAIGTSHAEERNEILTTVVQESAARIVC